MPSVGFELVALGVAVEIVMLSFRVGLHGMKVGIGGLDIHQF